MNTFSDIAAKLEQLSIQAKERDKQKGEHHQALFDEHLFRCRARLLAPCVAETLTTYDTILKEKTAKRLTALRAEYLTQLLLSQLAAIQRELATQKIRNTEIKHSSYYRKAISELYQDLSQHQEWETRLSDLVRQKTAALNQCGQHNQTQAQQDLMAAEQRLDRCKAATLKIERQITYREQHNPSNDYV